MDRPEALRWSAENCTISRALDVVGDRATFLVMREVFSGVRRFDDIRLRTGIARQVLSVRLGRLVAEGLLRRHDYQQPGQRRRWEYRLTPKGFDLYPVLVALLDWGDRYAADPAGPAARASHRDCGGQVHAVLHCDAGHDVTEMREVRFGPGPGARVREPLGA
ncbi:MAG: winged helix-turn-helix transcriptional regulator [Kineosporiaceae bacterium]